MTDNIWVAIGILVGAFIAGAIITRLGGRHSVKFWVVVLTVIGLASFIDSAVARGEDHYSEATYGLIISILCAYLVRQELNNMQRRIKDRTVTSPDVILKDYRIGPVRIKATRTGKTMTITATDEQDNVLSMDGPSDMDVQMMCDKVTDVMHRLRNRNG